MEKPHILACRQVGDDANRPVKKRCGQYIFPATAHISTALHCNAA